MTCKMQASLRIVWAIGALTFEVLTGNRTFGAGYKAVPSFRPLSCHRCPGL
jgi:hypothetical protein